MADFETMPVGTADAIRETAALLRRYEAEHVRKANVAKTGEERTTRFGKANRNRLAAERLEALLPGIPAGSSSRIVVTRHEGGVATRLDEPGESGLNASGQFVYVESNGGPVYVEGEPREHFHAFFNGVCACGAIVDHLGKVRHNLRPITIRDCSFAFTSGLIDVTPPSDVVVTRCVPPGECYGTGCDEFPIAKP